MVRNIGASIGTSTLTTYLTHLEQTRQATWSTISRCSTPGVSERAVRIMPGAMRFNYMHQLVTGQKQGLAMIYGQMQRQAMMLSLNDIYRASVLPDGGRAHHHHLSAAQPRQSGARGGGALNCVYRQRDAPGIRYCPPYANALA